MKYLNKLIIVTIFSLIGITSCNKQNKKKDFFFGCLPSLSFCGIKPENQNNNEQKQEKILFILGLCIICIQ